MISIQDIGFRALHNHSEKEDILELLRRLKRIQKKAENLQGITLVSIYERRVAEILELCK